MRALIFLILAASLLACQPPTAKTPKEVLPNIVFIFADDLGYGDLGCFGATDIKTPHIDQIAEKGAKLTSLYSASPVCSPSRAGLLTGRMPQRMGINGVFFPESFTGLPTDEITIADKLHEKGYVNGMVGKWHLGHLERFLPLQRGFDEYFGIPYSNDMESVVYLEGNEVVEFEVDQRLTTKTYTEKALDFLDRHQDQPFFLYLAHNMPHVPIYASDDFLGTSERGLYGDVIQEIDWSVGQILEKLESLGLTENTMLVFSSDNGPWLVMEDHGGSAGPLREGKQYTFEGGVRVPSLAMWPNHIPAGLIYSGVTTQMDWFPTFLHMAGIDLPPDRVIDGQDLSAALMAKGRREGDDFLFYSGKELRGYRSGKWKVKRPFPGFAGAPWMKAVAAHDSLLFDLENDPGEKINLFVDEAARARDLFQKMEAAEQVIGPLPPSLVLRSGSDDSHYHYLEKKHKK
ncbi:MAG: sulfatase [Bacteroidota bacterium]